MKFRGKNANVDIEKFPNPQFWLIPSGDLEYAPNFPPAAAYVLSALVVVPYPSLSASS